MPVGRLNDRIPLGHSLHRKLQEVVGSMDKPIGIEFKEAFFVNLDQ
jgi:hypothetical protein